MMTLWWIAFFIASTTCMVIPQARLPYSRPLLRSSPALKNRAGRGLSLSRAVSPQNDGHAAKFHAQWSSLRDKLKTNSSAITTNNISDLLYAFPSPLEECGDCIQLAVRFAKLMDKMSMSALFSGHETRLDEFLVTEKTVDAFNTMYVAMMTGAYPRMYLNVAMLLRAWHYYFPEQNDLLDAFYHDVLYELVQKGDIQTAVLFVRRHVTFVQDDIDEMPPLRHVITMHLSLMNHQTFRTHLNLDYRLLQRCLDAVVYTFTQLDLIDENEKMAAFYKALNEKGIVLIRQQRKKQRVLEWHVKGLDRHIGTVPVRKVLLTVDDGNSQGILALADEAEKLMNIQQEK